MLLPVCLVTVMSASFLLGRILHVIAVIVTQDPVVSHGDCEFSVFKPVLDRHKIVFLDSFAGVPRPVQVPDICGSGNRDFLGFFIPF